MNISDNIWYGIGIVLFVIPLFFIVNLLFQTAKEYGIKSNYSLALLFIFFVYLGASVTGFLSKDILSVLGSWIGSATLAFFLVLLQDFFGKKNSKQIAEIHNALISEETGSILSRLTQLEADNLSLKREVQTLKNCIETSKKERSKTSLPIINMKLRRKRSPLTYFRTLLNKK